jgi:hypothetical protein
MQQSKKKDFDFSLIDNLARNQFKKMYQGIIQYGTAGFRRRYV